MRTLNPVGEYRFILPAPELRRYLSSYYFFEIETPDGSVLDDFLHPGAVVAAAGHYRGAFGEDQVTLVESNVVHGASI